MTVDLHCAGCGAITSIPPLCGPCFAFVGVQRPIAPSPMAGCDWIVPLPGCRQHLSTEGLAETVANMRDLAAAFNPDTHDYRDNPTTEGTQ